MANNDHLFRVQRVNWDSYQDQIMSVRIPVFVEEQRVPEHEERDGLDSECAIVIAVDKNERTVGTARMLPGGQIGRMAVLTGYRKLGIGSAMLSELLAIAAEKQLQSVFLHGQAHAIPFYQAHGFVAEGPEFMEAGIPHRLMRLNILVG